MDIGYGGPPRIVAETMNSWDDLKKKKRKRNKYFLRRKGQLIINVLKLRFIYLLGLSVQKIGGNLQVDQRCVSIAMC